MTSRRRGTSRSKPAGVAVPPASGGRGRGRTMEGAPAPGGVLARFHGGVLDGREQDLLEGMEEDYNRWQAARLAERPPEWISTEHGVYVLDGPADGGRAWDYRLVEVGGA